MYDIHYNRFFHETERTLEYINFGVLNTSDNADLDVSLFLVFLEEKRSECSRTNIWKRREATLSG